MVLTWSQSMFSVVCELVFRPRLTTLSVDLLQPCENVENVEMSVYRETQSVLGAELIFFY